MNCKRCQCSIEYCGIGRKPKYCDSCSYIVNLEKVKKRHRMERKHKEELGTTNFSSKMKKNTDNTPNFLAETRAIKKEMRLLGLKKHANS